MPSVDLRKSFTMSALLEYKGWKVLLYNPDLMQNRMGEKK